MTNIQGWVTSVASDRVYQVGVDRRCESAPQVVKVRDENISNAMRAKKGLRPIAQITR